jgi:glycosyltransferase involved in cell wall biosynthesis
MPNTKFSIFEESARRISRIQKLVTAASRSAAPALFDREFYVRHLRQNKGRKFDAWKHYCETGHVENLDPHPLFDTRFYRERYLNGETETNPLQHYIQNAHEQLDPHPLLDIRFYVSQLAPDAVVRKPAKMTWLEYFLKNNLNDLNAASKEFSTKRYVEQYPETVRQQVNPLCHFVTYRTSRASLGLAAFAEGAPLFDVSYYITTNPDISESGIDPWQHFCDHGFREGRNPHPIFDTAFYRDQHLGDEPEVNPLRHYLEHGYKLIATHPLFDAAFYASQVNESFFPQGITPLQHFMQFNRENLASPSPLFSTSRYLEMYPDIVECGLVPLYHYLRHGLKKRRFVVDRNHLDQLPFASKESIEFAKQHGHRHAEFTRAAAQLGAQPVIVCVSHEGSVTGAPLIILKIAETIRARYGVEVINVIFRPGVLNEKFEQVGPTMDLDGNCPARGSRYFQDDMNTLREALSHVNVIGAIVNSAESREILPTLKEMKIPTVSLIHENARCYDPGTFDCIAEMSDRVVFPSDYVQQAAFENASFCDYSTEILPQGLLNESLLKIEPSDPLNAVRQRWGIPEDAMFILSCGTLDGRKGVDLFLSTAIVALSKAEPDSLYFGWLGGNGFRQLLDQRYWLEKDIEVAGLSEYVKLMGTTEDVTTYMQACDAFFLPSRIDPFPCVVNEAMAVAKPVVLFQDGSGCVPMIGDDGGAVVPYGNVADAAQAILELAKYPRLRREMGGRNRDYVAQNLDFGAYVEKVMECMLSAADLEQQNLKFLTDQTGQTLDPRDRRKVIFSLPSWQISGVNTFVENLVRQLCNDGIDASILFTTRDPSGIERAHEMPKVPYRFLSAKTLPVDDRQVQMKRYLEQNAPCVFVPNYDYEVSAITPDLPIDVGVLGVLHSDEDEHYLHGYQMGHYWDSIVTVSDTIKERFLKLNPVFASRTQTIRYGVPVSEAPPVKHFSGDKIRLIYSGRMVQAQKRIFDFLELIQKLDSRKLPFSITFIGTGDDENAFQGRLAPWVEKGVARYLGRCSSEVIRKELIAHDVLLLMSEFEGLPLSLLEGMAEGCVPVVTEIKSGISEILNHGRNGLLSPVGDVDAMVRNISSLHHDRELLQKLSEQAWATLEATRLSESQMASQYKTVIDQIFERILNSDGPITIPLQNHFVRHSLRAA